MDSNQLIVNTLESWGISLYTGVTGGGVIHFLKYLNPYKRDSFNTTEFLTFGEYSAGFVPLGYYLSTGKIAATVATTGAATKLISCGLSDAKLHDIPAVYIVPVSGNSTVGFSPLQDSTHYGSNIVEQLKAELPDSVFILNNQATLKETLVQAKKQLDRFKPVVLVLDNEGLNIISTVCKSPYPNQSNVFKNTNLDSFITSFKETIKGKRLVLLVGEEMARYPDAIHYTSELSKLLCPAVIWSINGANAVNRDNPYGYGYVSFGGNDKALSLINALDENDVLMILGACPDEYTVNFNKFPVAHTFFIGNIPDAYGLVDNSLEHIIESKYDHVYAPLDLVIQKIIDAAHLLPFENLPFESAPKDLNNLPFAFARDNYVDMVTLYQKLDNWWPARSIGIDDVCQAYKDRQYVTQRPNNNIQFYSLYRGSAMGGAFGVAVGAKLASPDRSVFLFTGDGCFRLFSGSMGEVHDLGLVLFLLNNETLGIVEQGLGKIMPDVDNERYHARLKSLDYCSIARACGWNAEILNTDLSNLDDLLDSMMIKNKPPQSLLIEITVDSLQLLGSNPRLKNL
ncbi:thiamine pyrophosphate-dependent enzyme [Flavobacterium sp. AJR]|uniref:thiamine pyrophosphate-dependent enzyme n=1 Tax=Flavobacterium sp. AJR TaxID=1979369 RepID=UPI000A3D8068|nr:thiamine pyrophosphate-dependent enzyme [Flavobacterium sp. AJR]OUL59874.1 acetolactate synthase II [Flavobacterium sp. AJR]